MSNFKVERYHDVSCGHRVYGHESKCAHLHGHNYRVHFICSSRGEDLDGLGRVIDFGVMKERLCMWIEDHWDHRFLVWEDDPAALLLLGIDQKVVLVPFNPTAENMASYLVNVVGPKVLADTDILLEKVLIEETAKCFASYEV